MVLPTALKTTASRNWSQRHTKPGPQKQPVAQTGPSLPLASVVAGAAENRPPSRSLMVFHTLSTLQPAFSSQVGFRSVWCEYKVRSKVVVLGPALGFQSLNRQVPVVSKEVSIVLAVLAVGWHPSVVLGSALLRDPLPRHWSAQPSAQGKEGLPLPGHSCVLRHGLCAPVGATDPVHQGQLVAALKFSDTMMVSGAVCCYGQKEAHACGHFLLASRLASATAGTLGMQIEFLFPCGDFSLDTQTLRVH